MHMVIDAANRHQHYHDVRGVGDKAEPHLAVTGVFKPNKTPHS